MKPYDIKVTGFVEIGAKNGYEALDRFTKMMQEKFPVADLRWKTVSIAITEDMDNVQLKETIANMQMEIDQLKLQVYFKGNEVLNMLLAKINKEFRPEDRQSNYIRNAMLRRVVDHIHDTNAEIDQNATQAFKDYIKQVKIETLTNLKDHFALMADNARENGYMPQADAVEDMCDEILEHINELESGSRT